jgi:FimV-like protein
MVLIICVVALLLLMLVCLFVGRCRGRKCSIGSCAQSEEPAKFDKEEFSVMESKEGIAAKLNLARAYIDMGSEDEAQVVLEEVLENGSSSEQSEAKELLEKITKAPQ